MSRMRSVFGFVATSFIMLVTGSAVVSAEQLLVPFECSLIGDRVVARPALDQSYPIFSGRESAPFTACATDNPNHCRTMMLHRFELDCHGARVAWPEFYAAISRVTNRHARMDEDRLLVRVRPQLQRRRAPSRFQRHVPRRSFLVEMPEGFAPVRGTVARFDGIQTPVAQTAVAKQRTPVLTNPKKNGSTHAGQHDPGSVADAAAHQPPDSNKIITKKAAAPKVIAAKKTSKLNPTTAKIIKVPATTALPAATPLQTTDRGKVVVPQSAPGVKVNGVTVGSAKPSTNTKLNATSTQAVKKSAKKTADKTTAKEPSVVPKIINVPQDKKTSPAVTKQTPTQKVTAAAPTPADPIQSLLQSRASQDKNGLAPVVLAKPQDTQVTQDTQNIDKKTAASSPTVPSAGRSPTLGSTLAVLATVASLLLALTFAGYRFLARSASAVPVRPKAQKDARAEFPDINLGVTASSATAEKTTQRQPQPTTKPDDNTPQMPTLTASKAIMAKPTLVISPTLQVPTDLETVPATPQLPMTASPRNTLKFSQLSQSSQTERAVPELPMPALPNPENIKKPDFEASALVLPTTRQEALTALGIGDNASEDVIEKVVAGLRQCWRPDEADGKQDRSRRLQRMQQIETAWRILSDSPSGSERHADMIR